MTTNLKWRLGKLPTPDEVLKLLNEKLITKEEARDILFNQEKEEDIKLEDLKSEIKFLRELVEKLSSKTKVVEVIKEIYQPYHTWGWYNPYLTWCGTVTTSGTNGSLTCTTDATTTYATALNSGTNAYYVGSATVSGSGTGYGTETASSFSDIKTF